MSQQKIKEVRECLEKEHGIVGVSDLEIEICLDIAAPDPQLSDIQSAAEIYAHNHRISDWPGQRLSPTIHGWYSEVPPGDASFSLQFAATRWASSSQLSAKRRPLEPTSLSRPYKKNATSAAHEKGNAPNVKGKSVSFAQGGSSLIRSGGGSGGGGSGGGGSGGGGSSGSQDGGGRGSGSGISFDLANNLSSFCALPRGQCKKWVTDVTWPSHSGTGTMIRLVGEDSSGLIMCTAPLEDGGIVLCCRQFLVDLLRNPEINTPSQSGRTWETGWLDLVTARTPSVITASGESLNRVYICKKRNQDVVGYTKPDTFPLVLETMSAAEFCRSKGSRLTILTQDQSDILCVCEQARNALQIVKFSNTKHVWNIEDGCDVSGCHIRKSIESDGDEGIRPLGMSLLPRPECFVPNALWVKKMKLGAAIAAHKRWMEGETAMILKNAIPLSTDNIDDILGYIGTELDDMHALYEALKD